MRFESIVNYESSKTFFQFCQPVYWFESIVNYESSKTKCLQLITISRFESIVNYESSKTVSEVQKVDNSV